MYFIGADIELEKISFPNLAIEVKNRSDFIENIEEVFENGEEIFKKDIESFNKERLSMNFDFIFQNNFDGKNKNKAVRESVKRIRLSSPDYVYKLAKTYFKNSKNFEIEFRKFFDENYSKSIYDKRYEKASNDEFFDDLLSYGVGYVIRVSGGFVTAFFPEDFYKNIDEKARDNALKKIRAGKMYNGLIRTYASNLFNFFYVSEDEWRKNI